MATFEAPPDWTGSSPDPADVQFGDVVERATPGDLDGYAAVLAGVPYDGAVIGREGARAAPPAIRAALADLKLHHFRRSVPGPLGDVGDVALPAADGDEWGDVAGVQTTVADAVARLHATDALPVVLGGDNSTTVGTVRPLLGRHGSVGVVSVDAHLDCRAVREGVGPTSGTPYRQLLAAGLDGLAVVGARDFETAGRYDAYLRERGGRVLPAAAVGPDPRAAARRALDAVADVDAVYVSLDVDAVDAAAAPGVSAPTPGGLSSRELFDLLAELAREADDRLAGVEVVECAPPLDEAGRTVGIAARAVAHVLAGAGGSARSARRDDGGGGDGDRGRGTDDRYVGDGGADTIGTGDGPAGGPGGGPGGGAGG